MKTQLLKKQIAFILITITMFFFPVAHAQIIYTDVDPDQTYYFGTTYNLDLNNDSTTDFTFKIIYGSTHCGQEGTKFYDYIEVITTGGNKTANSNESPRALIVSEEIDSWLTPWSNGGTLRYVSWGSFCAGSYGNWASTEDGYLGLKLISGGNTYYGWARLSVNVGVLANSLTIRDYAYNSIPDSSILAGEGTGYCVSKGLSTSKEYINLVKLDGIFNDTESNNGYGDFTNLVADLVQGSTNTIKLQATMLLGIYTETWRVWIDYNHDGDFIDAGEREVGFKSNETGYNVKAFKVPVTATPGLTRMRVSMKKGSPAQTSCEIFARGEVEDYSVNILPQKVNDAPQIISEIIPGLTAFPNPASNRLTIKFWGYCGFVNIQIFDLTGRIIFNAIANSDEEFQMNLDEWPGNFYILHVSDEPGHHASLKWMKE